MRIQLRQFATPLGTWNYCHDLGLPGFIARLDGRARARMKTEQENSCSGSAIQANIARKYAFFNTRSISLRHDTDDRLRSGQPTAVNDRNPQFATSAGSALSGWEKTSPQFDRRTDWHFGPMFRAEVPIRPTTDLPGYFFTATYLTRRQDRLPQPQAQIGPSA